MQNVEIRRDELLVGDVESYRVARLRVSAERTCHLGIDFLEGSNTIRGVNVQGDPKAVLMQPFEERLRVREQLPVPGISSPPASELWVDIDNMPIDVEHADRERNALLPESCDQVHVLLGGVPVEATPPVAQRVSWQHRRQTGHRIECPDSLTVIAAVTEEIKIGPGPVPRRDPTVFFQD